MVINELIIYGSTVLEIKSGYDVLCTFIHIENRVVSGEIYTTGKNFAGGSDDMHKSHLWRGVLECICEWMGDTPLVRLL